MTPTQREAALRLALRKSFGLGQTYWQQADSESYSQNKKADDTAKKFSDLTDETCAALLRELAGVEVLPCAPTYTEQQIADACMAAEVPDSKCESVLLALRA